MSYCAPVWSQALSISSFNLYNKPMWYHFIDEKTGQIKYFSKDFRVSKRYNLYINLSLRAYHIHYCTLRDNACCPGGVHLPSGSVSPAPSSRRVGSCVSAQSSQQKHFQTLLNCCCGLTGTPSLWESLWKYRGSEQRFFCCCSARALSKVMSVSWMDRVRLGNLESFPARREPSFPCVILLFSLK